MRCRGGSEDRHIASVAPFGAPDSVDFHQGADRRRNLIDEDTVRRKVAQRKQFPAELGKEVGGHVEFEHALLDAVSVALEELGNMAQPPFAVGVARADVVGDEVDHEG